MGIDASVDTKGGGVKYGWFGCLQLTDYSLFPFRRRS